MKDEQKIAQVNRAREIQNKHRYYQEHKHEIMNHSDAFGKLRAIDVWGISLPALDRMLERRGDGKIPAIDKRAMYPDGESYSQGVVKAFIRTMEELKNTISNLEDQLAGKDAIIAEKDKRIKQIQEDKQSFSGYQKEETIMQEFLRQIK